MGLGNDDYPNHWWPSSQTHNYSGLGEVTCPVIGRELAQSKRQKTGPEHPKYRWSDLTMSAMTSQITCVSYNRLFKCRSKKTSKHRVTGLCEGNPPVDSPHKVENVSIWWRHHDITLCSLSGVPMMAMSANLSSAAACSQPAITK